MRKIFKGGSSAARRRGTESFSGIESFYSMLGRGAQKTKVTHPVLPLRDLFTLQKCFKIR
jgi:hypothetical protein